MARPLRIEFPDAVYHVMNRGGGRQKTFLRKEDYRAFLKTLAEVHELWRVEVFAYCLLGNHYHLCLRTPEGNLSRIMRHLDGLYTQRFNRAHRRDGALFRGRYKAIVVNADEYLASVVRYIHLNPVQARLVKEPGAYPWSSHPAYLHPNKAPIWLNVGQVLGGFATPRAFHEFVLSGNDRLIKEFYSRHRQSPILGSGDFLDRIKHKLSRMGREHPRYERVGLRPSVDVVLCFVAQEYGLPVETLVKGRRGKENEARKVAMYLVKRLCDLTLQETAQRFNVGSYGVVGWACHGVQSKMDSDKKLRKRVEILKQRIYQQKI
jgi:REP element-mobilizing transposase RayT